MIRQDELENARKRAAEMIRKAGIVISDDEIEKMDVADFGLSNLKEEGAQIVALADTDKYAVRVIALFPGQAEPEHWHVGFNGYEGKLETLRGISGEVRVYLPGEDNMRLGKIPEGKEAFYTARHEIRLKAAETITIPVGTKHWFQAGEEGAVFYTISSLAVDAKDPFSNPEVVRKTVVEHV